MHHRTCLIIAGGKGTRCRPLTNYIPKPLLPIGGVPMILRTMGACAKHVDQYIILVDYMADMFETEIGHFFEGKPVYFVKTKDYANASDNNSGVIKQFSSVAKNFHYFSRLIPAKGQILEFLGDVYVGESIVKRMIDAPISHISGPQAPSGNRWEFWRLTYELFHEVMNNKLSPEQIARLLVCCQEFETPHRLRDNYQVNDYLKHFDIDSKLTGRMFSQFHVKDDEVIETNKPLDYFNEQVNFARINSDGKIGISPNCVIKNSVVNQCIFLGATSVINSTLSDCIICPDVLEIRNVSSENEILFGNPLQRQKIKN